MFDSHAHIAAEQFDRDRPAVIERARAAGLAGWLEVGSSVGTSRKAIELAEQEEGVVAAVGVHPDEINTMQLDDWRTLDELTGRQEVAAIGEVGLDFHRGGIYKQQIEVVERFVELAIKHNKSIVWHVRSSQEVDANDLLLDFLVNYSSSTRPKGVAHTFSGTVEQAHRYISLGFKLGMAGVVTFKNAGVLVDVVRAVPLESLLVETDSPYLAPEPYRGQRNEPAYVKLVAQKIAQLKNVTEEEVEEVTDRNFKELFGSNLSG